MAQLKSTNVMGSLSITGNILASKIIKYGGTNKQILLANGDVLDAPSAGLGTVTSVAVSSDHFTITGSPITTSGTIKINHPTKTETTADIYKVGMDGLGHVVLGAKIQPSDLGLSTVYRYMGTKTWAELKAITSAAVGDVYSITDKDPDGNTNADWACYKAVTAATGDSYATYWQSLGGKVDLSAYVQGPTSSTANAIARYDGTTGKIIKDSSGVTIDDNNKLKINATDTGGQSNVLQALSTSASDTSANWIGRSIFGSKTLTFLMGTYKSMAAIGAHTWTDSNAGSGAAWAPMYFQPDGGAAAAIYMGQNGGGWTANTGTLIIKGSSTANAGTVDVNGTLTATIVKKTDGADTHVLLAGGGTKALSDFGIGSSGTVGDFVKRDGTSIMTGGLQFNSAQHITWTGGTYLQRIFVVDDDSKDSTLFALQQSEDAGSNWINVMRLTDRGSLVLRNNDGGALGLTFDRNNNANWRIQSDNGNFNIQCDYTTAKGSYFNVLTMAYNTGNVSVDKGTLTSKGGFIHGNLTAASGKTKDDYILLAGGGTKALADFPTIPSNNITGDGVKGYLAVFDANKSITDSLVTHNVGVLDAIGYKMNGKATWQYNSSTDCIELVW